MLSAFCTIDHQEYDAQHFSHLSEAEISHKRRHLICIGCGQPAYFKREAKSGTGACFGARPHKETCPYITQPGEQWGGLGPDQDIIKNSGNHIIIDLSYGATAPIHADPNKPNDPNGRGGRFIGGEGHSRSNRRMRLRPILKNLIYSEAFRNSNYSFNIPSLVDSKVKDFFIHFNDVPKEETELKGFWGTIYDANEHEDGGALWLNTGLWDQLSILLEDDVKKDLKKRYNINDVESLAGCHVLAIGKVSISARGKPYVKVEGTERLAFYGE